MRKPTPAIPPVVKRSGVWSRLKEVLSEYDIQPSLGRNTNHYYLEIEVGHTPRKHFFSPTISDPRSIENNATQLRRVILTARAPIR